MLHKGIIRNDELWDEPVLLLHFEMKKTVLNPVSPERNVLLIIVINILNPFEGNDNVELLCATLYIRT